LTIVSRFGKIKISTFEVSKDEKQIYDLTKGEVLNRFSTEPHGLFEDEARKRLRKFGPNFIKKKVRFRWVGLVVGQLNNFFVFILLAAAVLSFVFGETRDGLVVLLIVFLNAAIGFFQEFKAERILRKIQKLTTDKAIVFRDGEKTEIHSRLLVPGDVVFISSGDQVPADGYLIESYNLYAGEFIFTGESKPNRKKTAVLDRSSLSVGEIGNMVFMGTTITRGEGLFVVTATGEKTELGRIALLSEEIKIDETPLQKRMRVLSRQIAIIAILIGAAVMAAGKIFSISWYQTFLFALALSVAVVPEGLPAALSVALSLGMRKLLKVNVLVKKLTAVETLGSVSVICTDKTGTITKNELTVTKIILGDKILELSGTGFNLKGRFFEAGKPVIPAKISQLRTLFKIGVLCNDAVLVKHEGRNKIIGDPTEGAIIVASRKYMSDKTYFLMGERKINEIPFSSQRMRMSVIYRNKSTVSYVKGSPDVLLELCSRININGRIRKITSEDKRKIRQNHNSMSQEALRVLAFAYRDLDGIPEKNHLKEAEKQLVWVGMAGMIDLPREGIERAIELCREAHIRIAMITGDYELTAEAIAKKIGLLGKQHGADSVIKGSDLDELSDEEIVAKIVKQDLVFARITPEQKLRIATVFKNHGMVIAMTGDGVNDALAIKKADIGISMGKIGTDVAKEASDMILLDDNLASIVKAVKEGRIIYQNVKKFVHYVLTSNASELFTVVLGVVLQIPAPISAIQILIVDLGTDVFPSLSLGVDPEEPGIVKKKPSDIKEKIITYQGFKRLFYLGLIMSISAVVTFVWSMKRGGWNWGDTVDTDSLLYIKSTSAAYAVIAMTQMANLLESRSESLSIFKVGIFKNKFAVASIFMSVALLFTFLHFPLCQEYFHLSPIDNIDWMMVFLAALATLFLEELRKKFLVKSVT